MKDNEEKAMFGTILLYELSKEQNKNLYETAEVETLLVCKIILNHCIKKKIEYATHSISDMKEAIDMVESAIKKNKNK